MQKIFHSLTACAAALLLAFPLQAQEALTSILRPAAAAKSAALPKTVSTFSTPLDTLDLPFFDDFSGATSGIPDPRKWCNRYVFVNSSYPINQPTMGVATFDIADEHGFIYKRAGAAPFEADSLTSMPIRLQAADTGVYFSFAYQPAGEGDMPERMDSLTLQFYAPLDSTWVTMWSARTDTLGFVADPRKPNVVKEIRYWISRSDVPRSDSSIASTFFPVIVPVSDARFLHPGFRFMFVSYGTRPKETVQGKQGDTDMWNVDMVYLNKNRSASDLAPTDVAIQTPLLRLLKDYTAMPWQHLRGSATAQVEQLITQGQGVVISPSIANLYSGENAFRADVELSCVKGSAAPSTKRYSFGTIGIAAATTRSFDFTILANDMLNAPAANADSVAFDIKLLLSNYRAEPAEMVAPYRSNDTCVLRQNFYTYYAYDDGTAENGYGVFGGNTTEQGRAAVKFKSYLKDTLSGIYIYFNHSLDSGNIQPFRLTVWADKNGEPGSELYVEANRYPRFDSLNSYVYYPLTRPVVIGEGATFYVGWVQQSDAMLNVGFDKNSKATGKNYYYDKGQWARSKYQGAVMIRPSFAKRHFDAYTSVESKNTALHSVKVYPNPVGDELHLDLPEALRGKDLQVEIFSLSGARVMYEVVAPEMPVNVARLGQGAYLVRFGCKGKPVGYARFVKR